MREREMTEQEFAELTEGETVETGQGRGTIQHFTEHGAAVELDANGVTINVEYPKLSRA